jgi:cell division septation protein DedD
MPVAAGDWYVQLGAFDSAGVAKDAWGRAQRRFAGFKGHTPNGMTFKTASASFYRLSVGGFSRAGADSACRQYRAQGGTCFVRSGAGDQVASWVQTKGVQLAMR